VGAAAFLLLREGLSRLFPYLAAVASLHGISVPGLAEFPHLIPLGIVFIAMVIFMPQGLLGFARRWLNQ
jgi:ABC-type branched-subunit amino acid transport system permease subunit